MVLSLRMKHMKRIDLWVGNILCGSIAIYDKIISLIFKKMGPEKINRILIIKFWGFGNLLMTMPLIRAIKEKFPKAEINFLTLTNNKGILETLPHIKGIIYFRPKKAIADFMRILLVIRKERFDTIIDLEQFLRLSAILTYLSGASNRIGFRKKNEVRHLLYNKPVLYNDRQHTVKTFCDLAKSIGAETENFEPLPIEIGIKDKEAVERFLAENNIDKNSMLIGMHIGSGENAAEVRQWPKENFAKLADMLASRKAKIIFTGSKSEVPIINETISLMSNKPLNAAGNLNLPQLAYLAEKCSLFVSNDTGPVHLAAAVKTRTVSFYGPNTPFLYGPVWGDNDVFYKNLPCSPCITNYNAKSTKCKDPVCITGIKVQDVYNLIDRRLFNH